MASDALEGRFTAGKGIKEGGDGRKADVTKATAWDSSKAALNIIRCPLLEISAEIRNRIYHFAEEELYNSDAYDSPVLVRYDKTLPEEDVDPEALTTMAYLALTQVCQQIRAK